MMVGSATAASQNGACTYQCNHLANVSLNDLLLLLLHAKYEEKKSKRKLI
jgi:hypothetical protein